VTGRSKESSLSAYPETISSISCLKRSDEVIQLSLSVFRVTSFLEVRHTDAVAAPVLSVSPLKETVPTTESVLHGVVDAIPILPEVELMTKTSPLEPSCMRTAVVEEIFCWKPPAAVKNEREVPPEEKNSKRFPVCEAPAVISIPELVLEVVESTLKMLAPAPSSTRTALA